MIYDCFTFFNELDLLEIRLNYLDEVVDKFVLVEMNKTHSGQDKPLYFKENKSRYKKFLNKIIYIEADTAESKIEDNDSWVLENYQRDCIMNGLKDAADDDIVIISDLDEIPSKDVIKNYESGIVVPVQKMMYYYLNCLNISDSNWNNGTRIGHYSDLKDPKQDMLHMYGAHYTSYGMPTNFRFCNGTLVQNGGWHFSCLGGAEAIAYKIKSYAHQEFNSNYYTDTKLIEERVKNGKDIFNRDNYSYRYRPLDDSFPDYILKHKKKFKHLILNNPN